jgi:3-isopropylmalate/(R)-2-methylmalate dehydratase small subunit
VSMEPIKAFTSRVVPLLAENIDTDQIIPARFLKTVNREGLGDQLFCDWRYLSDGSPDPDFVLNRPEMAGRAILLAGDNFGCGSSREHAPWALTAWGIRVVLSSSFADIFRNNALKNGLVPVVLEPAAVAKLMASPGANVRIDLGAQTVTLPDGSVAPFPLDGFARYCLMNGVDELGFLLSQEESIARFESRV